MKSAIRIMLPLLVLAISAVAVAHGNQVHTLVRMTAEIHRGVGVVVNGNELQDAGFIYNDRTYLPVRAVAEALGAKVDWDGATNTAKLQVAQTSGATDPSVLAQQSMKLNEIRRATAKYVDIQKALSDGYVQSSGMIPNHGYHFMKPLNVLSRVDLSKPAGLIYLHDGDVWQLAAVEYSALLKPSQPLLPGGQWIIHEAACHYADGNELIESNIFRCPKIHPRTNSPYSSWHPSAWTFHVWAYYPNPLGLFAGENPLLAPYNVPGVDVEHHHHGN